MPGGPRHTRRNKSQRVAAGAVVPAGRSVIQTCVSLQDAPYVFSHWIRANVERDAQGLLMMRAAAGSGRWAARPARTVSAVARPGWAARPVRTVSGVARRQSTLSWR
jgi:hypothetical protein